MNKKLKAFQKENECEEIINDFLVCSGFINYIVCFAFYMTKYDYSRSGVRFTSALIGITLINMCSSFICFNEFKESLNIKLIKYISALSVFTQVLLIMLTTNEWSEPFIRIMVLNIISYIPFAFSYLNRLIGINKTKGVLTELLATVALICVTILNVKTHNSQLAVLTTLSSITIAPNLIIQIYYYLKRRS